MNDQAFSFYVAVDPDEPNIAIDQHLTDLFPDKRIGVVMPRQNWPSYTAMDLSKAQVHLNPDQDEILITAFNLALSEKEQRSIPLKVNEPENMRFQIQYTLGQLGALTLSNGNCSGTTRPSLALLR